MICFRVSTVPCIFSSDHLPPHYFDDHEQPHFGSVDTMNEHVRQELQDALP